MPTLLRPTPAAGALLLSVLLTATAPAIDWQPVERITHNALEDRTTSGSLANMHGLTVVWMQEQPAPGWRIMWSDLDGLGTWSPPLPVDPSGLHPDYEPRIDDAGAADQVRFLTWQRGSGTASEIMYATGDIGAAWTVEPITTNTTEDVTPDIAWRVGEPHVVWAGYDPISDSGKIFHAVRGAGGWQVERLVDSELGPFWTGAAPKVALSYNDIVYVVYRGGDFGDYHAHYARKQNGVWTYQVLTSGNGNDLVVDVAVRNINPVVAMSGNDGFGFPSRIYVRDSTDSGMSFRPHVLASGNFSASLDNVTAGLWYGANVVGSEVSGNIYTGNLVVWAEYDPVAELLPPADQASSAPAIENASWIVAKAGFSGALGPTSSVFTNDRGGGADSAEVYFLTTPAPVAVGDGPAPTAGAALRVTPNPSWGAATITATSGDIAHPTLSIYDPMGRLVRTILPTDGAGAAATFRWDGRSAAGQQVAGGVYFLRLDGTAAEAMTRLTIVR